MPSAISAKLRLLERTAAECRSYNLLMSNILVIDYGMGNILSVLSALRYVGATPEVSSDPEAVANAHRLVLPGVGSFRRAMESLRSSGLDQAIHRAVRERESRLLGICLGMQLLGTLGTEDGETEGLGLVDQRVDAFTPSELAGMKIPHIGFRRSDCGTGIETVCRPPCRIGFLFCPLLPPASRDSRHGGVPAASMACPLRPRWKKAMSLARNFIRKKARRMA